MSKMRKRLAAIVMAVMMVVGFLPEYKVNASGEKIKIDQIVVTSNISSVVKFGEKTKNPTFEIIEGQPVSYNSGGYSNWQKKRGDTWDQCKNDDKFTEGIYRLGAMFGLYNGNVDSYEISETTTLTVDGKSWNVRSYSGGSDYSYIYVVSPEFEVKEEKNENDGLVHEVHFEIPEPEDGRLPSNNIKLTTVPANAYTTQFVNAIEGSAASRWKKSSDNEEFVEMATEEAFEAGNYYKNDITSVYAVSVVVASIGGTLYNTDVANNMASDMKIYVNGKEANSEDWTFKCRYDISLADVNCSEMWEYTGNEITPVPEVILDSKKLTLGTDYTLSYEDNKEPGNATMVIEGIGWYKGTKTFYFGIKKSEKKVIDEIVATSNISSILKVGNKKEKPKFIITKGMPVRLADAAPEWEKKNGDSWEFCEPVGKVTCGSYRNIAYFSLWDDDKYSYALSESTTVTIDNQQWKVINCNVKEGYIIVVSPEFEVHDWGEWKVTTPATETSEGEETRVCKCDSSHIETRKIPKLTPTSTPSASESKKTISTIKVGDVVEDAKATYVVTSAKASDLTVAYASSKTNSSSVVISDEVKINGKKYKVTEIKANAFKNNKNIKKITIGKNIKKIGKNAFYGCKKLKKIIIKTTKLTKKSVGENAFAKINKKAKVKVPKKKLKTYKKVLKARGIKGRKQKITSK